MLICLIGILLAGRVFRQTRPGDVSVLNSREATRPAPESTEPTATDGPVSRLPFKRAMPFSQPEKRVVWHERLSDGVPVSYPNEEAIQEQPAVEQRQREKALQADVEQGVNEVVHHREVELRVKSQPLKTGWPVSEVLKTLGKPSKIYARINNGSEIGLELVRDVNKLAGDREIFLTYSPNDDRDYIELNGTGYQVLTILFGTNRTVARWSWETPIEVRFNLNEEFRKQYFLKNRELKKSKD